MTVSARRLSVALLGLASALACVGGPVIPRAQLADWHVVGSDSFRLVGDAPPQELARLAAELVEFEAVFTRLTQRSAPKAADPVAVYLIADRELARRFFIGPGGVAGWTLPTLDGCFAVVGFEENHGATRRTLQHEYTHALLRRGRRSPVPPWLDEGLSSYFSTVSTRDGAVVVGAATGSSLAWIGQRGLFPLERLFESAVWKLRRQEIGDFYATAWALSHYLLGSPTGRHELSSFASQLERGVAWRDAHLAAFGRSAKVVEQELDRHVARLARGAPVEAILDPVATTPLAPLAPLSKAEAAYELGYLALLLAESDEGHTGPLARALLEIARSEDPGAARAEAALAETEATSGDAEHAALRVQRALARAPADARIRVHAGRVELARADAAGSNAATAAPLRAAEDLFRSALELEPGSALAWTGLGKTWRRAGRTDEAIQAFEQARRLGWSAALDLELGSIHLERGQRDEAVALLWPLAQDPHRTRENEQAAELLQQAGLAPAGGEEP